MTCLYTVNSIYKDTRMRNSLFILAILLLCCSTSQLSADNDSHADYVKHVEQGFLYLFQGDNQATIKAFESALAIEPNNYEILHYLGMSYASDSSWNKAVEVYNRSLALKPDNIELLYSLAIVYFKLNQWENAVEPLKSVISLSPQHARAHEVLGKVYVKLRQYTEAVDILKKAIELKPNAAGNYYELGNAHLNLKSYPEAIDFFNKAIQFGPPDFADPHFGLGTAYLRIGNREKSREEMQIYQRLQKEAADYERFTRLTRVDPNNLDGWTGLAGVMMRQKKYKRVIPVFQKCIEIGNAQNAPAGAIASYYHGLSQAFINIRYPKLALEPAQKAIQLLPTQDRFYNTLGSVYAMLGDVQNAISVFRKAVELNEEQPYYHLNLSKLYKSIGNHKLGDQHYQAYEHFLSQQNKTQK